MINSNIKKSLEEVYESVNTSQPKKWKKILSFIGPAYLVSIGYMDPGNWATDIAAGSKFGYQLIWILLMSNIMAIFLQYLSAKLGIVYGRDLAQANKETFPITINFILYLFAEIAIISTDIAEIIGMAIGLQLLFHIPLIYGVSITIGDTLLLLYLQKLGIRKLEMFIISLIVIIAASFIIQLNITTFNPHDVFWGLIPQKLNSEALYIGIGIIGATIMPHNLYLHSALVQTRKIKKNHTSIKQALKINLIDSIFALNIAFFINASILILAASTFFQTGNTNVTDIHEAHRLLTPLLGNKLAPILFAIALIAAGQSSTITGTLAGQIVMEGYLQLRLNPWIRRLLTRMIATLPIFAILLFFNESKISNILILSQVVLSCQLGFAIIPLIHFVSDKNKMHIYTITPIQKFFAWIVASILILLNMKMIYNELVPFFNQNNNTAIKILIIISIGLILFLLIFIIAYPLIQNKKQNKIFPIHSNKESFKIEIQATPIFNTIAIPVDFSKNDEKLIKFAIQQKNEHTKFILIHIVESASAKVLGNNANDLETQKDIEYLNLYKHELEKKGIATEAFIGFRNRNKEIIKIIQEQNADLLVIGSHGHKGIKDLLFGETINEVRHSLKIPILIININE